MRFPPPTRPGEAHVAFPRRQLDSATEPRMVAATARLTTRRCFRRWRHATPSSAWSPPDVQMCHLSDSKGCLLTGTRQNGPRRPGGVEDRPKPVTEPQGASAHSAERRVNADRKGEHLTIPVLARVCPQASPGSRARRQDRPQRRPRPPVDGARPGRAGTARGGGLRSRLD